MDYVEEVKKKYPYLSDDMCLRFVNKAKSIFIEQAFPNDWSISYLTYTIPARFDMWILDCVDEFIERAGCSSATAYRENGVSITWDNAGVSNALLRRIKGLVGTVK